MAFTLAHLVVGEATAPRTALILHGILGCGRNWRSIARRFTADGTWRVILADLRGHGDSKVKASTPPAPPHTLAACARDVMNLVASVGPVHAVIGHSFGGKVALTYARDYGRSQGCRDVWVLDSPPGQSLGPTGEVGVVLKTLADMPTPLASREELANRFDAAGIGRLSGWMSTNLHRVEGGFGWRFDLDIVNDLLADYQKRDLWRYLHERDDGLRIHLVRATRGDRWTEHELSELERVDDGTDTLEEVPAGGTTHVYQVDAGHWLHVDDPDGLLEMLNRMAPTGSTPTVSQGGTGDGAREERAAEVGSS